MTVAEMQINLVRLVSQTTDKDVLTKLLDFFKKNQAMEADWYDEISDYEKELIKIGEEQIEKGEGHSWEEVKKEIDMILKNK